MKHCSSGVWRHPKHRQESSGGSYTSQNMEISFWYFLLMIFYIFNVIYFQLINSVCVLRLGDGTNILAIGEWLSPSPVNFFWTIFGPIKNLFLLEPGEQTEICILRRTGRKEWNETKSFLFLWSREWRQFETHAVPGSFGPSKAIKNTSVSHAVALSDMFLHYH